MIARLAFHAQRYPNPNGLSVVDTTGIQKGNTDLPEPSYAPPGPPESPALPGFEHRPDRPAWDTLDRKPTEVVAAYLELRERTLLAPLAWIRRKQMELHERMVLDDLIRPATSRTRCNDGETA